MRIILSGMLVLCSTVSVGLVRAGDPGDSASAPSERRGRPERANAKGDSAGRMQGLLKRFDPDGDGKVALADLPQVAQDRLSSLDGDKDGILTREELAAGRGPAEERGAGNRPDPRQLFKQFDANGDGKLTQDEVPERMQRLLARIDANGDQAIDEEEMSAIGKRMKPGKGESAGSPEIMKRFESLDADGDGRVLLAELPEAIRERVARLDGDQDGAVTKEELLARAGQLGQPGGGKWRPPSVDALLKDFDGDNDGKLSAEELKSMPRIPVDRLDTDGDGALSRDELSVGMDRMRKMAEMQGGKGLPKGLKGNDERVNARQMFDDQDADADGRVTKEEAGGVLADRFGEIDSDADGKLSVQEVETALGTTDQPSKPTAGKKRKAKKPEAE